MSNSDKDYIESVEGWEGVVVLESFGRWASKMTTKEYGGGGQVYSSAQSIWFIIKVRSGPVRCGPVHV